MLVLETAPNLSDKRPYIFIVKRRRRTDKLSISDEVLQGGVLGLTQSLNSLARIVGPMWGGFAFDHLGIGMPYVTSAAVMGLASLLALHALWRARLSAGA